MKRMIALALLFVVGCGEPPSHSLVTSDDGVEIAYTMEGEGEPALLFVHGWTLNRSFWGEQMDYFSDDYKTVAIDLAGHGESGDERMDWTMEAFGRDVAATVDDLGLRNVVLVGHSMGGSVVLEAFQHVDDRVDGIVLVDAFHNPDESMPEDEREGILAAYRSDFRTNVGGMVREYLFAPETDSILADRITTQMSSFDPAIGIASIEELFRSDYREVLLHIEAPIVAINSDLYPTNEESMTRYGIAVRTMSGVGHFPMVEDPDRFNEILSNVLQSWR